MTTTEQPQRVLIQDIIDELGGSFTFKQLDVYLRRAWGMAPGTPVGWKTYKEEGIYYIQRLQPIDSSAKKK